MGAHRPHRDRDDPVLLAAIQSAPLVYGRSGALVRNYGSAGQGVAALDPAAADGWRSPRRFGPRPIRLALDTHDDPADGVSDLAPPSP